MTGIPPSRRRGPVTWIALVLLVTLVVGSLVIALGIGLIG